MRACSVDVGQTLLIRWIPGEGRVIGDHLEQLSDFRLGERRDHLIGRIAYLSRG